MTTLMVSAPGGHITELVALAPRLRGIDDDQIWVTWRVPQTESLLQGKRVVWANPVPPRDALAAAREVPRAISLIRSERPIAVVSNGSAISVPYLTTAAAMRVPAHYIECCTRITSPSLSGRILSAVPGVATYTQFEEATNRRWILRGSVLDGFTTTDGPERPIRKIVVILGTMEHSFRRALERLVEVIPADAEVLWQTGHTPAEGLGIQVRPFLGTAELEAAIREADLVVGHAGIGTALDALMSGHLPVLLPRDPVRGEHVDDHQYQLAGHMERRGLARICDASSVTFDDLQAAANAIVRADGVAPFQLTVKPGKRTEPAARAG